MQTKLINSMKIWISAYFKDGPDSPTGEATFFEPEADDATQSMAQRSSLGSSDGIELTKAERKAAKKARKALKAELHASRVRRAGGRKKKKGGKKKGKGRPGANSASASKTMDQSCLMRKTMLGLVDAIASEINNACNGNRCHNDGN